MKLLAVCSRPCRQSPARRSLRWSNDALPVAPAGSRFLLTGRRFHSRLPLHGVGPSKLLRRNAFEPEDCAGDGGGNASSIRFRQAAACALCVLAKFRMSRRDGILLCLQQSRSATSAGARAEHTAPNNYGHPARLGDRSTARYLERGAPRAPARPFAFVGDRPALGNPRPGPCVPTSLVCPHAYLVSAPIHRFPLFP